MTRPTKKTISPLLEEFAQLSARRLSLELQRDLAILPHKQSYEKKIGPIVEAANAKLKPLDERLKFLHEQIDAELMAGVDRHAETVALSEVVVEVETTKLVATAVAKLNGIHRQPLATNSEGKPVIRAVASVEAKPGNREIAAEQLFAAVPESERTGPFWACLKVLMGPVDKFLGKDKVDALAKRPKLFGVSISLKP